MQMGKKKPEVLPHPHPPALKQSHLQEVGQCHGGGGGEGGVEKGESGVGGLSGQVACSLVSAQQDREMEEETGSWSAPLRVCKGLTFLQLSILLTCLP